MIRSLLQYSNSAVCTAVFMDLGKEKKILLSEFLGKWQTKLTQFFLKIGVNLFRQFHPSIQILLSGQGGLTVKNQII